MSEVIFGRTRADVNIYRRDMGNYADDDQLLNAEVGYLIAFDRAVTYGSEGKLELVQHKRE